MYILKITNVDTLSILYILAQNTVYLPYCRMLQFFSLNLDVSPFLKSREISLFLYPYLEMTTLQKKSSNVKLVVKVVKAVSADGLYYFPTLLRFHTILLANWIKLVVFRYIKNHGANHLVRMFSCTEIHIKQII